MLIILGLVIPCLLGWVLWKQNGKLHNLPPGPPGMLSYFSLNSGKEPFISKDIIRMSKIYGSVIGLRILHKRFVCVNGYEAVAETLSNPSLTARPETFVFNVRTYGSRLGVLMTDGNLWKEQRRFTARHLKDFGFGKMSMEGIMLDEINELIADLEKATNSSSVGNIVLDDTFTIAVLNILWVIVAGKRFDRRDPKIIKLAWCMNGFMRFSNGGPNLLTMLPFLRFIAPQLTGYNDLMQFVGPIKSYLEEEVAEHKKTRDSGAPRDFIDVYLEALYDEDQVENSYFSEEQLVGICFDIFLAGSETTSHSLGFAILFMITHPEIQSKIQEEIDQVLLGRLPSLSDRGRLPLTEATLLEVQRLGTVVPITVPHVAEKDTSIKGYYIPKGTMAFVNIWSVHMDEDFWPEPENFRPERHLNQQGNVIKSDHLLAFGLGKRICMGEMLARNSLFLFFTAMMQHFRFNPPIDPSDSYLKPSMKPIPGFTLAPRPCLAHITKRNPRPNSM